MSSAALMSPPTGSARLVVDTDVASYIFKWHPVFAPKYLEIVRDRELLLSFMTVAEMRQGALAASWGKKKRELLEAYLADFGILHSDGNLCNVWAEIRNESAGKGRAMGSADAWIAATDIVLECPLVTNNPKHFGHLDRLSLVTLTESS